MAIYSLDVKINGVKESISTVGQLEQALAATREEMKGMDIGSQAFKEMGIQARALQGELENSFEKMTNFNGSLDNVTQSAGRMGSTVAAGFALVLSSMSLFGGESEELTQAQIKAQNALAIAFAATTLATNAARMATDAKILKDQISLGLSKLLTRQTAKQAVATGAQAVATGGATTAQLGLNAAMMANPIVLVITALAALTAGLVLFTSSTEDAVEAQESLMDQLDLTTTEIENQIKRQRELNKLLEEAALDAAETEEEKYKIRKEYAEKTYELDLESLEAKKANLDEEFKANQEYIDNVVQEVRDKAEYSILGTGEQKVYTAYLENLRNFKIDQNTTEEEILENTRKFNETILEIQATRIDKEDEKNQELIKNSFEANFQLAELEKDIALRKEAEKQANINRDNEEARRVKKEEEKKRKEEEKSEEERKKIAKKAYEERLKLIQAYNDAVISLNQKLSDELTAIERAQIDYFKKAFKLKDDDDKKTIEWKTSQIEVLDGLVGDYKDAYKTLLKEKQIYDEELKKTYDKEFKDLDKARKAGKINQTKYNEDLKDLNDKYKEIQILKEEEYQAELLTIQKDSNEQKLLVDRVLQNELAYGDNSIADSRKAIALEALEFEVEMGYARLENAKGIQAKIIQEIQKLEEDARASKLEAELEALVIEEQEKLASIENSAASEEQKLMQEDRLRTYYLEKRGKLIDLYLEKEKDAEKKAVDEIYNYRIQKLGEYADFTLDALNRIGETLSAFNELTKVKEEERLKILEDSTNAMMTANETATNDELDLLQQKYEQGLISQEQYNEGKTKLDDALAQSNYELELALFKAQEKSEKAAFEQDKKLKIAQAIIAGLQGIAQAFASTASLGVPAGPIAGAAYSALIAATTAAQIAAIKKTTYTSGAAPSAPSLGSGSSGGSSTSSLFSTGSTGGLTKFTEELTNIRNQGGDGGNGGDTQPKYQRVYVLESDISEAQVRVFESERNATFG